MNMNVGISREAKMSAYHTITKTAAKTNEALSPGAVSDKMHDSSKQINRGPHKSPRLMKTKLKQFFKKSAWEYYN